MRYEDVLRCLNKSQTPQMQQWNNFCEKKLGIPLLRFFFFYFHFPLLNYGLARSEIAICYPKSLEQNGWAQLRCELLQVQTISERDDVHIVCCVPSVWRSSDAVLPIFPGNPLMANSITDGVARREFNLRGGNLTRNNYFLFRFCHFFPLSWCHSKHCAIFAPLLSTPSSIIRAFTFTFQPKMCLHKRFAAND